MATRDPERPIRIILDLTCALCLVAGVGAYWMASTTPRETAADRTLQREAASVWTVS